MQCNTIFNSLIHQLLQICFRSTSAITVFDVILHSILTLARFSKISVRSFFVNSDQFSPNSCCITNTCFRPSILWSALYRRPSCILPGLIVSPKDYAAFSLAIQSPSLSQMQFLQPVLLFVSVMLYILNSIVLCYSCCLVNQRG